MENKKILLGMSGGVDSSVAAILLKQKKYEVIGVTMKLWQDDVAQIEDAKKICQDLQIPHYTVDFKEQFKCQVVNNFINEYTQGKTPNPCVECNKYIKFGALFQKAKELGCTYVATGHYAKSEYSEKYGRYVLKKSDEEKKDQTYFLYQINNNQIKNIIFPLQEFKEKEEIRKIAKDNNLVVSKKPDSQEICFIPDKDYITFVTTHMKSKPKKGNIVLKTGEILGTHTGIINYTIGQRKGLGISYKEPLYVIKIDVQKNEVIVGTNKDLYSNILYANNINWLAIDELKEPINVYAKIRYRAKEAKATIYKEKDILKVVFEEPQRAITPGQSVVFYDNEGIVIGGAKIVK